DTGRRVDPRGSRRWPHPPGDRLPVLVVRPHVHEPAGRRVRRRGGAALLPSSPDRGARSGARVTEDSSGACVARVTTMPFEVLGRLAGVATASSVARWLEAERDLDAES